MRPPLLLAGGTATMMRLPPRAPAIEVSSWVPVTTCPRPPRPPGADPVTQACPVTQRGSLGTAAGTPEPPTYRPTPIPDPVTTPTTT